MSNPLSPAADVRVAESQRGDFVEYEDPSTIERYRPQSAGEGISHLLRTTYGPLFLENARAAAQDIGVTRLRVLEFGCGAGMALQHLVATLPDAGLDVELAVGTDFSPGMVEAARREAAASPHAVVRERTKFAVAPNEALVPGIAAQLGQPEDEIKGTFHLAIGVNTFRYAIRHGMAADTVTHLHDLLASGGRVVNIDMNDRFPYGLKPKRTTSSARKTSFPIEFGTAELPSLEAYGRPFRDGGFTVERSEHFCWVPHSANGARFKLLRAATPLLDKIAGDRAMRSLIVARRV